MSKTAFLFPGQGAQKAGMGKDFYENSPLAAEIYDRASELLSLDMKALCFEENDRLDLTEYTQAALVTTCLAMERVLKEAGVKADIAAGLSLGEYCAIHTAGGMTADEAIKTVRTRGILMQDTVPAGEGAMAAVLGMEASAIEDTIRDMEGVWIANYNCPGQIVITGAAEAVEKASAALKENGAKRVLPLNVSGPFHSPLLIPAGEKLMEALDQIQFTPLSIPYVTNVTAEPVTDIGKTKELLKVQVSSSVRWQQSMEYMLANGVDTFVEIGPGRTLAGFLKKIDRSAVVYNVSCLEDVDKAAAALA
ncbi:MAG TPA: ACP S-malonyltransferase [Candidatus Scatomonas merdavium]|nr:ACP S-malonyltransferase [Candidatus Scatomonas merdavium]